MIRGNLRPIGIAGAMIGLLLAAIIIGMSPWGAQDKDEKIMVSYGNLDSIEILQPDNDPEGLVILVSERAGIGAREQSLIKDLLDKNMIVLPVDLGKWGKKLDADDGECLYLGSDLENIGKAALRQIGQDRFFHPVIAGIGEGGTLAYAAIEDAPFATFAGAAALDPADVLKTRLPTCPGTAVITPAPGGGFSYSQVDDLPAPATFITATGTPVGPNQADVSSSNHIQHVIDPDASARITKTAEAIATIALNDQHTDSVPIVDIPAKGTPTSLVLFYSGDGGWRDLDKSIGNWLADKGVHVVGIDSLSYFWTERKPEEIAKDAVALIAQADPGGKLPVAVFGYSFGADVFPFAFPHLPESIQNRINMIALLGTETTTRFQVSVGSWLGLGGDMQVAPAIAALPADRVVCVYGADEDETACNAPELSFIEKIQLDGGHHFDGDYETVAAHLLQRLNKRIGVPASAASN